MTYMPIFVRRKGLCPRDEQVQKWLNGEISFPTAVCNHMTGVLLPAYIHAVLLAVQIEGRNLEGDELRNLKMNDKMEIAWKGQILARYNYKDPTYDALQNPVYEYAALAPSNP